MRPNPVLWFVVGCAVLVAMPLPLEIFVSPSPSPVVPACFTTPYTPNVIQLPAGQIEFVGWGMPFWGNPPHLPLPPFRLSIWSNSSAIYIVFLLNSSQYQAFWDSHHSGPNGSVLTGHPDAYLWSSGIVTSTNRTMILSGDIGMLFLLVYNPGLRTVAVSFGSDTCGVP